MLNKAFGLLDLESGQRLQMGRFLLRAHEKETDLPVFSPDGKYALSGGADGMLIVWDLASGEPARKVKAHEGEVWAGLWSQDGKTIVSRGKTIRSRYGMPGLANYPRHRVQHRSPEQSHCPPTVNVHSQTQVPRKDLRRQMETKCRFGIW